MIEYLVRMLKGHRVAVLSRGYKRKSKGFQLANPSSTVEELGDEPNQLLDTRGYMITHLYLNALGDWTLNSPLNQSGQWFIYNGGLSFFP